MTTEQTPAGQKVYLHPPGMNFTQCQHVAHILTSGFRIIQFVIPAGREIPTHEAEGEIILHCLEGEINLDVGPVRHNLTAGQLVYLAINEAFTMRDVTNASLLATIIAPKQGENVELIGSQNP